MELTGYDITERGEEERKGKTKSQEGKGRERMPQLGLRIVLDRTDADPARPVGRKRKVRRGKKRKRGHHKYVRLEFLKIGDIHVKRRRRGGRSSEKRERGGKWRSHLLGLRGRGVDPEHAKGRGKEEKKGKGKEFLEKKKRKGGKFAANDVVERGASYSRGTLWSLCESRKGEEREGEKKEKAKRKEREKRRRWGWQSRMSGTHCDCTERGARQRPQKGGRKGKKVLGKRKEGGKKKTDQAGVHEVFCVHVIRN